MDNTTQQFRDELTIQKISIKNFRGIKELELNDFSEINFAFGSNGTNKSSFLFAIRLLLERGFKNKYEFDEGDFNSFSDSDEIEIKIKMNYPSKTKESSPWIYFVGDFWAKLVVSRVGDDKFEPKIFESKNGTEWQIINKRDWEWLKGINLIFIKPNYELDESKRKLINEFKSKNRNKINSDISDFQSEINTTINEKIDSNEYSEISNLINIFQDDKVIDYSENGETYIDFFDMKFNLSNQISLSYRFNGEQVKNLGDGIGRIESMNLDIKFGKMKNDAKISIILLEEVENNLHVILQRKIISELKKLEFQNIFFITTHSANMIHYNEGNNFIRFSNNENSKSTKFTSNERMSPFVEISIAEALFYENVYIVEGDTEIMFYDMMYKYNEEFASFINDNNIYIHRIGGAYGYKFHSFFNELGINVVSKIDNDVDKDGIHHRIRNVFNHNNLSMETLDETYVDNNWVNIESQLHSLNVVISKQKNSFEGDLEELLNDVKFEFDSNLLRNGKNKHLEKIIENVGENLKELDIKMYSKKSPIFKFLDLMRLS